MGAGCLGPPGRVLPPHTIPKDRVQPGSTLWSIRPLLPYEDSIQEALYC